MAKKSENSLPGVYTITHRESGRVYVGRSREVQTRWVHHRWHLDRGKHRNGPLQRDWTRCGAEAFDWEIALRVQGDTIDEIEAALQVAEVEVLSRYRDFYNLMEPGEPALVASEDTRAKLSRERKARWADPEYRARMSEAHKRKHQDPEWAARRAASIRAARSTPEAKAVVSARTRKLWEDGGTLREKHAPVLKAIWNDPEYRAKQTASRKASHADPESKARRSAALKAAWARRKAMKASG